MEAFIDMEELEDGQKDNTGLYGSDVVSEVDCRAIDATYWSLNSSRGRSVGVDDSARSGRMEDINDPKVALNEGGESSDMFWYALSSRQRGCMPDRSV